MVCIIIFESAKGYKDKTLPVLPVWKLFYIWSNIWAVSAQIGCTMENYVDFYNEVTQNIGSLFAPSCFVDSLTVKLWSTNHIYLDQVIKTLWVSENWSIIWEKNYSNCIISTICSIFARCCGSRITKWWFWLLPYAW